MPVAGGNSGAECRGSGELYWFGHSLKVTQSHIWLPCRQTERETEASRSTSHKALQSGAFWRYLLISCPTAPTFLSLPFYVPLFFCPFMASHYSLNPPSSHLRALHWNDAASWAIRMGLRHGNKAHFEPFLSKCEQDALVLCKQFTVLM